ncbi:MAG TPA: hypothetical protein VEK08_21485 [Planctomycetota bacterium]|nr:hypothetical protein [Planctomycetota bacterium]
MLSKLEVNESGERKYKFWLGGGGYDRNLTSWEAVIHRAEYCHKNPVKRRLVKSIEQWRWSSFRWLVLGSRDGEPLKVDDWVDA